MKSLKRLGVALALTFVLGVTALAGETPTPPCAPGETPTPPCASQMMAGESLAPGQTETPPAASENEYSFAAAAINLLQSVLLIF